MANGIYYLFYDDIQHFTHSQVSTPPKCGTHIYVRGTVYATITQRDHLITKTKHASN